MAVDAGQAFDLYRQAAQGGDFRGRFNYARLLLQRGRVRDALAQLQQIRGGATPAFMHNLHGWLRRSAWAPVRALADETGFKEFAR